MEQSNKSKMDFDNISIPKETDDVILAAIKRGRRRMKVKKLFKSTVVGVAACLTAFIISVNTIPAFANQFSNMPILSYFVEAIKLERGLEGAADEGFLNPIQQSVQDGNIEFGIDNVIFDGKHMIISYTLNEVIKESSSSIMTPLDYTITDEEGNILFSADMKDSKLTVGNHPTFMFASEKTAITNGGMRSFKWENSEEKIPEKMFFVCSKVEKTKTNTSKDPQDWETSEIAGEWSVPFEVDLTKTVKPKIYKDIEVTTEDNMKFTIDVEIYPTLAEAKVVCETELDYDLDFFLVDDEGNIFDTASGGWNYKSGVTTWMKGFESCYYSDYKSLYLVARPQANEEEFQKTLESLNKYNDSQLKKAKDSKVVMRTICLTNSGELQQIDGLDQINALDENGNWVIKDDNGNILWKQPVHIEPLFKVQLK